jgi:hypothetical protein
MAECRVVWVNHLRALTMCSVSLVSLSGSVFGQATVPNAGLQYIQTIPIPNLTTTGTTQANFDIFGFNPETRIMYYADRVNHGISGIDTRTNNFINFVPVPGNPSTVNGVLIVPELQQMVVTDGQTSVFVYDLRIPGNGPDTYHLPSVGGNTDALDYDPLNHTVYVINGTAPYYLTGIDLLYKTIRSQFQLPGSPELLKFNLVDGLIYQVITDNDNQNMNAGLMVYDPVANKQLALYPSNCVPHGIGIDPIANTALLGCGTNQGQVLMSLQNGNILKTFPDVTGTDLLDYNPNLRRFYTGSSSKATTSACPSDTTGTTFPIIGVIDAKANSGTGGLIGVTCGGRSLKVGVDPIQNFIYTGVRQYPADPNSQTTGTVGVAVFHDPVLPAQPLTNKTQTTAASLQGSAVSGAITTTTEGRIVRLDASLRGVSGKTATVNVATTVGIETVECSIDYKSGNANCNGDLLGDPMVGGPVLVGMDGAPVARGTVTLSN